MPMETASVGQLIVSNVFPTAAACAERTRWAPSPVFSPRKSLICVDAISSAMPLVKPIVTGAE